MTWRILSLLCALSLVGACSKKRKMTSSQTDIKEEAETKASGDVETDETPGDSSRNTDDDRQRNTKPTTDAAKQTTLPPEEAVSQKIQDCIDRTGFEKDDDGKLVLIPGSKAVIETYKGRVDSKVRNGKDVGSRSDMIAGKTRIDRKLKREARKCFRDIEKECEECWKREMKAGTSLDEADKKCGEHPYRDMRKENEKPTFSSVVLDKALSAGFPRGCLLSEPVDLSNDLLSEESKIMLSPVYLSKRNGRPAGLGNDEYKLVLKPLEKVSSVSQDGVVLHSKVPYKSNFPAAAGVFKQETDGSAGYVVGAQDVYPILANSHAFVKDIDGSADNRIILLETSMTQSKPRTRDYSTVLYNATTNKLLGVAIRAKRAGKPRKTYCVRFKKPISRKAEREARKAAKSQGEANEAAAEEELTEQ